MHLVNPLISGIRGAEAGTAEFFERGSTQPAPWWLDFEGQTQQGAGTVLQLDSNGGGTAYVGQMTLIRVRSNNGTVIREFVAGDNDNSAEVQSPSFTGTDYFTGQANTANKPTTLGEVLDRWFVSAGATDWNVLFRGAPTTLQGIASHIVFYSVKAIEFGAVGDDTTDDTAAIQAAIDAAEADGGGIVFFPPGTYRVTATVFMRTGVSLLGVGAANSLIRSESASVSLQASLLDGRWHFIEGLTVFQSNAVTVSVIAVTTLDAFVHIRRCVIGGASHVGTGQTVSAAGAGEVWVDGCFVSSQGQASSLITGGGSGTLRVTDCTVVTAAGYNSGGSTQVNAVQGASGRNFIHDNHIDMSAGVANPVGAIGFLGEGHLVARGNVIEGSSSVIGLRGLTNLFDSCFLHESQNEFSGSVVPYDLRTVPTTLTPYEVHLGSRKGRRVFYSVVADESGGSLLVDAQNYEFIEIEIDAATGFSVDLIAGQVPLQGSEVWIHFKNESGAPSGNITFLGSIRGTGTLVVPDQRYVVVPFRVAVVDPTIGAELPYWLQSGVRAEVQ